MRNISTQRTTPRAASSTRPPWRVIVRAAFEQIDGPATLRELYAVVHRLVPPEQQTRFMDAKVRQVLQKDGSYERVGQGVWQMRPPLGS